MARLPVLRGGRLDAGSANAAITVDTPQWRAWLAEATGFLVEHPAGTFAVRRERSGNRRGSGYWRAHRNTGGRRHRVYLGGSDQLTAKALDAAGAVLGRVAKPLPPPAEAPLLARARLPPPRDRLLARPRVRALLDRATRQPLMLICAPAGHGKTTAVASWAAGAGAGAVAWLSLDPDDNHPPGFCRQLAAALEAALPAGDVASPPALRRWLTELLNQLAARPGPLHLIVDDYHRIESSDVHDAVTYLAEHLPHQLHLVLVTRHPPPLPLARWRAQHRLADLGTAHSPPV